MNTKTKKPRTKTRINMKKRPGGGVARSWLSVFMAAMLVVGLAPAPVFATGETNPQATPGELTIGGADNGQTFTFSQHIPSAKLYFKVKEDTRPTDATAYTWSVSEGTLPDGLSFVPQDDPGEIALFGTPTTLTEAPVKVTLKVESVGTSPVYVGTLSLQLNVVPPHPTDLAYEILSKASCEVDMATANTQDDVETWLTTWLINVPGLKEALDPIPLTDLYSEPFADSFQAATMGTPENPAGTAGSLRFSVKAKMQSADGGQNITVCENLTCTITPTAVYKLTLENGTIEATGETSGYFTEGTKVVITTQSSLDGDTFAFWKLADDAPGTIEDTSKTNTTFTMGSGNATVSALFGHVHDGHIYLPYDGTGEIPEYAYLTKDVSLGGAIWPTHLCLNGKKLAAHLSFGRAGSSLHDHAGGSLNGTIKILNSGASLAMHGGSITGTVALAGEWSSFTMYNGSIGEGVTVGDYSNSSFTMYNGSIGGGVQVGGGYSSISFTMYNGTVQGNVVIDSSKFNMSGGTVLGGVTLGVGEMNQSGGSIFGGVVVSSSSGIVQTGGSISGTDYGLRVAKNKTCGLNGDLNITGGKAALYLEEKALLSASGISSVASTLSVASEVTPTKDNPVNITRPANKDLNKFFTTAMPYATIKNSGEGNAQVVQLVYNENATPPSTFTQNEIVWTAQFKPSNPGEGNLSLGSKVHNPTKDDLNAAIEAAGGSQIDAQSYTVPSNQVSTNVEGALVNGTRYPVGQVLTFGDEEVIVAHQKELYPMEDRSYSYEQTEQGEWTTKGGIASYTAEAVSAPVVVNGASYLAKYRVEKVALRTYLFLYLTDGTPAGVLTDYGSTPSRDVLYTASFNPGCDPDSLKKAADSAFNALFNKNGQTYQLTTLLSQDLTVLQNGQATPTLGTIIIAGELYGSNSNVVALHRTGSTYDHGTVSKVGAKLQIAYPEAYQSPFMVFAYQPLADPTVIVVNDYAGSKATTPATGDTTPFVPLLLLALTAAATTLLTHRKRQTT